MSQFVGKDINPTPFEFTKGELITLYLSFLTDLACSSLRHQEVSRYVLRQFAMPCWQIERADWADRLMRETLAKAQILADTFSGKWAGGVGVAVVRGALDALGKLDRLPVYLIDQGVLEAIAAASSSLPRGTGERRLYMVVDVGAGTTDYGLFAVTTPKGQDDRPKVWEVPDTTVVLRQAGDAIDKILLRRILEQEEIKSGDPEYDHVNSDLLLRIRTLKENMFRDELADSELTVVLTGGGAKLPMVRALGEGVIDVHEVRLRCELAPYAPAWLTEQYPDLVDEYSQLAVAIGGAAEELPRKGGRYEHLGILTDHQIVGLETHYKGV